MSNLIKLTSKQIDDIVSALPPCMAACSKIAEKMRYEIQKKLRLQLQDQMIVNKPEAIEKLKAMIRMQHYTSMAIPGEPIGLRAAEAVSQPVTQAALNAFHSAGAGGGNSIISKGVDGIRELYFVSSSRKMELTFIHFKNKNLIFDDIIELRRDIESVSVKDLLTTRNPEGDIMKYEKETEPWWYNLYLEINNYKLPFDKDEEYTEDDTRNFFLRLQMDMNKIYSYNITPYEVAFKLNNNMDGIVAIPSPAEMGIVDIFIKPKEALLLVEKKTAARGKVSTVVSNIKNASLLFLQISLQPQLKDIPVNGIKGLNQVTPHPTQNIKSLMKVSYFIKDLNVHRIVIDKVNKIVTGIPISKLINTLTMCGFEIIEENDEYLDVKLVKKSADVSSDRPEDVIKYYVNKAEKELEQTVKELDEKKIDYVYRDIYPELLKEYNYVFAYAYGCNLKDILSDSRIDPEKTLCNNPHQVLDTLGIEAARNFMIKSYNEWYEANDNYINPHHITLLADFQTSKGALTPINFRGLSRQKPGPLAQASFEQPMEVFIDAAAFGKKEQIKSSSTAIYTGKRMILGTGSFKAALDVEAIKKAEKEYKKYKEQNPDKFNKYSKSTERIFVNSLVDDEYIPLHSDDNENQNGTVGLEASMSINPNIYSEIFKYKNLVPKATKSSLNLPVFIQDIIRIDALEASQPKFKGLTLPKLIPFNKGSLSKEGLPALPNLSVQQLLSLNMITSIAEQKEEEDIETFE
jgi:DNA-directed RNA polymerase beta' subunit